VADRPDQPAPTQPEDPLNGGSSFNQLNFDVVALDGTTAVIRISPG
jgi:hypothetical protein